jgi:hypothetical protein
VKTEEEGEKPKKSFLFGDFGGNDDGGFMWNVVDLPQFDDKVIGGDQPL